MIEKRPSLIRLVNGLFRYTQAYTDEFLEKYELSSGTYPFLLKLFHNEGISQNQISKELGVDKAMSARSIKKLIELGYIRKELDEEDNRAYKLFLTEKAKAVIPDIKAIINHWVTLITEGSSSEEEEVVERFLNNALLNAKKYKTVREEGLEDKWKK